MIGALSLFASFGTLLCCALPVLLVALGLGATVASVVSTVPWFVTLSRYKDWLFAAAALLLVVGFSYRRWVAPRLVARELACSLEDPRCRDLSRAGGVMLWLSAGLYVLGAAAAYGLPLVYGLGA